MSEQTIKADSVSQEPRNHTRSRTLALVAIRRVLPQTVALALVGTTWEAWTHLADIPIYVVPAPSDVWTRLAGAPGYFAIHTLSTLTVALGGFLVGSVVAIAYAAVMSQAKFLERALYPVALMVKVVPILVWGILFVIWFGFGPAPRVLIAALITFFPVMVNALAGLRAATVESLDLFHSFNASRTQVFWKLRVPSSLPYLFTAFKISIPLAVIGAFVAEYFTGDRGIGSVISIAHSNLDMPTVFSAVVVLAAVSIALTTLTSYAERRLLFWHDSFRREQSY